jgi:hypothetical protein
MPTTESARSPLNLRPGELVRVRSPQEIFLTLDDEGMLDGLPFMPEMVSFCGRTFSVSKRADKTCGHAFTWMRRVHDAVHLSDVRCAGSGHGGCQAACLLFWKEAWLERVETSDLVEPSNGAGPAHLTNEGTRFLTDTLRPAATNGVTASGEEIYRCQATELPRASTQLRVWHFGQYLRDVRNWGFLKVARSLWWDAFNRYQTFSQRYLPPLLRFKGGEHYPFLARTREQDQVATPALGLQSGDVVRIRQKDEILSTLDHTNKDRGLSFDPEMLKYCGRTARVRGRVERLIDEENGTMIRIRRDCIILDGVICTADYHQCCTRSVFPYWREGWLEKVADPRGSRSADG